MEGVRRVQKVLSAVLAAVMCLTLWSPHGAWAQANGDVGAADVEGDISTRSSRRASRAVGSADFGDADGDYGSIDTGEEGEPEGGDETQQYRETYSEAGEEPTGDDEGAVNTPDPSEAARPNQTQDLPTGPGKSAVTPQKISLPKAEGSIEGMGESFTPNLSAGTGTFSVPIALPPGRAGVQPSLALTYSTGGGNGAVGFGWSLGVPFIARQTDRGLPRYQIESGNRWHPEDDRFIYNGGQELVPVDNAEAAAIDTGVIPLELEGWQQYRARVEGAFMRFFRDPDGTRWVVQDKSGTRFDFGVLPTGDGPPEMITGSRYSLQSEYDDGHGRVFQWNLTRMSDAHGSTVYYQYAADQGQRYIQDIYYVSPNTCAVGDPVEQRRCPLPLSEYARRVHFVYENRIDVFDSYTTTWRVATAKRLRRVEITAYEPTVAGRTLVRRYHLRYDPTSYHSLLEEVQVEGRPDAIDPITQVYVGDRTVPESSLGSAIIGRTLPPMRFTYSQSYFTTTDTVWGFGGLDGHVHDSPQSPPHSVDEARSDLFDVNNDGLPDLIVTDPARYRTNDNAPAVGVFFNGFTGARASVGEPGGFSDVVPLGIPSGQSSVLNLGNLNIQPMDIDGDGRSDILHMPRVAEYSFFTPTRDADRDIPEVSPRFQGWRWSQVPVALAQGATDPRIDFGRDSAFIKTLDVNNDHLIDVVKTTGTVMQTWLNLGWVPGGDGLFGHATYAGGGHWDISPDPIESCLLYTGPGSPVDFENKEIQLADMNGDGIQDIVRIRKGRVVYWPGRGPGIWGVGDRNCDQGEGDNRYIDMTSPPQELNPEIESVYLSDVNQDGAADIVQVRYNEVDVWFNKAGQGFTERIIIEDTPYAPAYDRRIRFADIDGTGTTDIIYGNADNWQWIDPLGGIKPRLLTNVENGLGGLTTLEYGTSIDDYLADLAEAENCRSDDCERFTWSRATGDCEDRFTNECAFRSGSSPVVTTVVRAIETSDQFGLIGAAGQSTWTKRTEYAYHDAYYEGIEQEFRGFGAADAIEIGDLGHPTSTTRTHFYQGRRPNAIASNRLIDNPNEALKGNTYLTEVFDENGVYLSTTHATFTVRKLLEGIDRLANNLPGTAVSYAFVSRTDAVSYDVTNFVPGSGGLLGWTPQDSAETNDFPAIEREQATDGLLGYEMTDVENRSIQLRSGGNYAHIATTADQVDNLGHMRQQTAWGRLRGEFGETPDEHITSHTQPTAICPESGTWLWRTAHGHITGHNDGGLQLNRTDNAYDCWGDLLSATQTVAYTPDTPNFDFSGDGQGAQSFTQAAEPVMASTTYDSWGNPLSSCGGADMGADGGNTAGCLRYAEVDFDATYAQFPEIESIAVGKQGDAFDMLSTAAQWDPGQGVLLTVTDPNNLTTSITYDGLARFTSTSAPNVTGCEGSRVPLTRISYDLTPNDLPISIIHTTTEQSCASVGADPLFAKAYVDGLGRTRAALLQAEAPSDTPSQLSWHRSGLTTFHKRGTVYKSYQPDMIARDNGAPSVAAATMLPATPDIYTLYDPFGRPIWQYDENSAPTKIIHHALSADVYDALDLDPSSPHHDTPVTERKDGHGRVIDQVQRNKQFDGIAPEYYRLWSDFRADNKVVLLTRAQTTDETHREAATLFDNRIVQRSFFYDSVGRRVGSFDPDTDNLTAPDNKRSWRYLFNRVGDLVAARDPRGCGQNFYYDYAGRLVAEDYVQCAEAQASTEEPLVSVPPDAIAMDPLANTAQKADVRLYFDAYPVWFEGTEGFPSLPANATSSVRGLATAAIDRGQRSAYAFDDRGNVIWAAKQMAVLPAAGLIIDTLSGDVPHIDQNDTGAVEFVAYDSEHTYTRTATFDHAARPRAMTLPRDPDFNPSNPDEAPLIGGIVAYNARNLPRSASLTVDDQAFPIVSDIEYTRDGLVKSTTYGDGANGARTPTISEVFYDDRRRPIQMTTWRQPTAPPNDLDRPLNAVTIPFSQYLVWDDANNLIGVRDQRLGHEWPEGFRPQSYWVAHDSLYRVVDLEMDYTTDTNAYTDQDFLVDYRDEMAKVRGVDPMRTKPAPMVPTRPENRVVSLTYDYDWLANMVDWTDDAHQFYERSIGRITNGVEEQSGRPSALRLASNLPASPTPASGDLGGYVELDYGLGGNVISMTVRGQCTDRGASQCFDDIAADIESRRVHLHAACQCGVEQHYQYRWDELNRLAEARRYDRNGTVSWELAARQRYRYDSGNKRTVKQTLDPEAIDERIALYIYSGDFERRGLARSNDSAMPTYDSTYDAETQYLVGRARVVWKRAVSSFSAGWGQGELAKDIRVTVALSDLIQTTSAVIDLVSGALVETSTYYPSGARENYRAPANIAVAPEPQGFTAKEADEEVGLIFFGERCLIPRIGRWATPDPLWVHAAGGGEALNAYHYVSGNLLQAHDPLGLFPTASQLLARARGASDAEMEQLAVSIRTSSGIPQPTRPGGPDGWYAESTDTTGDQFGRRVGMTRKDENGVRFTTPVRIVQRLRDPAKAHNVSHQMATIKAHNPNADTSLVLAFVGQESGPSGVSAGRNWRNCYQGNGCDQLGTSWLQGRIKLPPGTKIRVGELQDQPSEKKEDAFHETEIRQDHLIIGYGGLVEMGTRFFEKKTDASERAGLTRFNERVWHVLGIRAGDTKRWLEQIRATTKSGEAVDLNRIVTDAAFANDDRVRAAIAKAAQAEFYDRTINKSE